MHISPEREIVTTRVFPYLPSELYASWTDPERLARWWGPKGFTNTFHEFDLTVGGHWRFTMHGPTGANFENECVFTSLEKDARVEFDHVVQPVFHVVATFVAVEGGTLVTFRQVFGTKELAEMVRGYAASANEENFDRLAEELGKGG